MDTPQLPPALLATIAGAPQVDQLSFAKVKPCPYTGWWKVAVRFDAKRVDHPDIITTKSIVVGTPFIVAEVIMEAVRGAWPKWTQALWDSTQKPNPRPRETCERLLWYGGLTWLPSELKLHRLAVAKNPNLRRVLGHAGSKVELASDGSHAVDVTPNE